MLALKSTADVAPAVMHSRVQRARPFKRPARLWLTAFCHLLSYAAMTAFVVYSVQMAAHEDRAQGMIALGCLGGFIALRLLSALNSGHLACSLCHGPVLISKGCQKHRNAFKLPLLGHLAVVVFQVVFSLSFKCMYCATSYKLHS
jgi:hypothetical protein